MKKTILFVAIFMGMFSCWCDEESTFWNFDDFEISLADTNFETIETDTFSGDSLFVLMIVESTIGAQFSLNFTNSLMAFSCDPNFELRDPITTIDFFSDNDFNDISAGQSLEPIIRVFGSEDLGETAKFSNELINNELWDFLITERPQAGSTHRFTVRLNFESGRILERQSQAITWN